MKSLKDLMKTGVFGVMSNGDRFVIANHLIVYHNGQFDHVNGFTTIKRPNYHVSKLYENCDSFNQLAAADNPFSKCKKIYDYKQDECVEMTVAEIEKELGIKNLKIIKEDK